MIKLMDGVMKNINPRLRIILIALVVISLQLACRNNPVSSLFDIGFQDDYGMGQPDISDQIKDAGEALLPTTPVYTDPQTPTECVAAKTAYHWSYEDNIISRGTGGVTCNSRMLITNTGSEPLLLMLYESFDNNAMKFEGWKSYSLPPGSIHEKRVSHTIYTDGVITFDRVDKMLVIRDLPACVKEIPSISQAAEWPD